MSSQGWSFPIPSVHADLAKAAALTAPNQQ